MHIQHDAGAKVLRDLSAGEHERLVRLCAHLTGDWYAAEDLAQETFLVAWRLRTRLVDRERVQAWLSAIARNVCRHWQRNQRHQSRYVAPLFADDPSGDERYALVADPFDLELELERDELARLLDQALGLLPAETRAVLVQKYIDETPLAAIAERLGLSENAVAVRLHRGKLAFRRVLNTKLHVAAEPFGLVAYTPNRETGIWCPICGVQKLRGNYDRVIGRLDLRCPLCCPPPVSSIYHADTDGGFGGATQIRTALLRGMCNLYASFREGLVRGALACSGCSHALPFRVVPFVGEPPSPYQSRYRLLVHCESCGSGSSSSLRMFVQSSPEVRAFWKQHP